MDSMHDVVSKIPDVKPWLAMKALHSAMRNETHGVAELCQEDRNFIWRQDRLRRTSPIGGRILVNLFDDGKIPQKAPFSKDISDLIAYCGEIDAFREKIGVAIAEHQATERLPV